MSSSDNDQMMSSSTTGETARHFHCRQRLVSITLSHRFRIRRRRRVIRNVTNECVTFSKVAANPRPQFHGLLPVDGVNPGPIFDCISIDYAGSVLVKYGPVRKQRYTKGYIVAFVCLATKAVHLELVSDLTTTAFKATLRRFIGRRGIPRTLCSDHSTDFVGAKGELNKLLREEQSADKITGCCT